MLNIGYSKNPYVNDIAFRERRSAPPDYLNFIFYQWEWHAALIIIENSS